MKTRILLICLAIAAAYSGCDKIKTLLHLKSRQTVVVQATPTPSPTTTPLPPTPTPTPVPTPVQINKSAGAIILCYHRFEDTQARSSMILPPAEFEKQMQALKENGFTVIPMQDFLAWRRGEKDIPAKSAIITIDDGYVSAYDTAWPILKKFGYPFTMYVYVQYVNSGGKAVTWDQLAEMRDGGVDIGCHSYTHQNLLGKPPLFDKKAADEVKRIGYEGWLRKEIVESKQIIEKQLGIKVATFSYPLGKYNEKAREIVKEAGYEAAVSTYGQRNGFSNPPSDLIGRYAIEANKPQTFQVAVNMIGGGYTGYSEVSAPISTTTQIAATAMETEPAEGATVSNPKPLIKANLESLGALEPNSVEMRISGFGRVLANFDEATKTLSFQPTTQPLRDKDYTVIVSGKVGGKKVEARWSFKFDPAAQ